MANIAEIEDSIQTLPANEFFSLIGWMTERHLQVLASDDFEAPELEEALLKSLDSPRHALDDALFDGIRETVVKTSS